MIDAPLLREHKNFRVSQSIGLYEGTIRMIKNGVGREIPEYLEHIGKLVPYENAFSIMPEGNKVG